ncbi:MAG: hypothetical protein WD804_01065 [Gemmatimonadota bacterium]
MSLRDLIYLCPFCGGDPVEEKGMRLRCPKCERTFEEVVRSAKIRVEFPSGEGEDIAPGALARRVEEAGSGTRRATTRSGELAFESRASARIAKVEEPVFHGKEVVGFIERRGSPRAGTLLLAGDRVRFEMDEGGVMEWPLLDIRALQGSSSSLQISPLEGGVVTFRFEEESSRRWEELLKAGLRRMWSEAGRGEIAEFQPRIRVR